MAQAAELAMEMYAAIKSGDFAAVEARLAPDCVIEFYGSDNIPYAGIYRGRAKCMVFFDHVRNDVDILRFDQDECFGDAHNACVTGHLTLRARATGVVYDTAYAHVIRIEDGLWKRFRDFADTEAVAQAFTDHRTRER